MTVFPKLHAPGRRRRPDALRGWAVGLAVVMASSAAAWRAEGQIEVDAKLPFSQFIPFEPITVTLRISNEGSGPLDFAEESGSAVLRLDVERAPGRRLTALRPVTWGEGAAIQTGESQTRELALLDFFDLKEPGPYTFRAVIEREEEFISSAKAFFDVVPGLEVARLQVRDPAAESTPKSFSLWTLHRGPGDYLLLRIDDRAENRCLGVYQLGRLLRLYRPVLRTDREAQVHVLHHSGPASYTHSVFGSDGVPVTQEVHTTGGGARLAEDEAGRLVVRLTQAPPPGIESESDSLKNAREGLR